MTKYSNILIYKHELKVTSTVWNFLNKSTIIKGQINL